MVVASIDIQNGKVVQLKQGKELVLERDNAIQLVEEFNRYGEIAVIDLDAAMGTGNNLEMIKPLLYKAECRVGGGIRTVEKARELVSLGARKIIVGSAAFREPDGSFRLNANFLENLAKSIGRERIILAIDARKNGAEASAYEITVDGWKTPTGLDLIETASLAENWVSEVLFTCVDREGTMSGTDLEAVKLLWEVVSCHITAAGGVTSMEEIETLAGLGCDVQLGMALYTNKIKLDEAFVKSLNWLKSDLLPVIAQSTDGQVLMTGFADSEAIAETFKRGNLCLHSRTRDKLWMKGETSGNVLKLIKLRADCDKDALLATVEPTGPVCHTGAWTCFEQDRRYTLNYLQSIIDDRFRNPIAGSYTATLDNELVREKVLEEAKELCAAKTNGDIVWEAADLFYFVTALLTRAGVTVPQVIDELEARHKK